MVKCLVNGAIDEATRQVVVDGLCRLDAEQFGGTGAVTVEFIEIPDGRWFTAGRPSKASMVLGTVPAGTPQDVRIAYMDAVAQLFATATGTDYHDVMVSAPDRKGS